LLLFSFPVFMVCHTLPPRLTIPATGDNTHQVQVWDICCRANIAQHAEGILAYGWGCVYSAWTQKRAEGRAT